MVKKILTVALLLISAVGIYAQPAPTSEAPQQAQVSQLPLNPQIRTGVLPNGLTYYVMHNEEPKNRANFYIAQKVGSALENESQLGLAHFLEHMAFNGTTHYPGKNMLNYLQDKGIRFGQDINAYTYYDETVYNINNVPTNDKALMDSVLLCLADWSCGILLEEAEIDSERGVIEGEWRQRNDANFRLSEAVLPQIFQEFPYQQMVIGKLDIIRNFKYQEIRDYYKKWYRPDLQGIIVVGDFDAAEMEEKVKAMFSSIPMPENAAPRTYTTVSDNEKPLYAYFEDAELSNQMVMIAFKSDAVPFAERNSMEYYVQKQLLERVFCAMINARLAEEARKADCPYAFAQVYSGRFRMALTKEAFNIIIIPKTDVKASIASAMGIVSQACKTGFLPGELERAKSELLASYEKAYNERNKNNSDRIANEIIRHFLENEPTPGIETEYNIAKMVLNQFPVQLYNEMGKEVLTDNNQVMVISRPKLEGQTPLMETEMISTLEQTIHADYEPYVDEEITDPLISNLPTAGKITSSTTNAALGTTEFTLSNGAKVVVKSTDFAEDEILFQGARLGGLRTYSPTQADNLDFITYAVDCSKVGNFKQSTLEKYLAGKMLNLSYGIGSGTDYFSGKTTVKDLPTFMELLYAYFTEVSPDADEWASIKSKLEISLKDKETSPQGIFMSRNRDNMYGNNPLMSDETLASLAKSDYLQMLDIYKNSISNAADFTFYFVGNVDVETLKPLLEQYIATLPAAAPSVRKNISNIDLVSGLHNDIFQLPMAAPATLVFNTFSGANLPYNADNTVRLNILSDILQIIYTRTLREEIGGTYGASTQATISPYTGQWLLLYFFNSEPAKQDIMMKTAYSDLMTLLQKGAKEEDFNKVKEATLKQFDIRERKNNVWLSQLMLLGFGYDSFTKQKAAIENLTLKDFNTFLKKQILPMVKKNRINTVMEGVPAN